MQTIVSKIQTYFRTSFQKDLIAGIVVGLVALPLSIALAIASGASAEQGLYTAIIGGALIALFGGSEFQVSGPTAAFVVLLLGIVNQYGMQGLLIAGFMAGIILLLMGIAKLGTVIKFIPYPVIIGLTAGIAVLIFAGQIANFLGLQFAQRPHDFIETLKLISENIPKGINPYAVLIGGITLLVYFIWPKINKKFPPAPIALFAGIIAGIFFQNQIQTIGNLPSGLPQFHILAFDFQTIELLLPAAFTIAILGAIESLLSAVVADGMTGKKHDSNQELIGLGIGNITLPFFGAIPATGAFARTATNIKNGAQTRNAAIIHSITVLAILFFFAPYAKIIPLTVLAAILMMVAYNMSEIHHFRKLLNAPRSDVLVLFLTFGLTVFVDLTMAVGIGVVLAAILFIRRISEISVVTLEDSSKKGNKRAQQLQEQIKEYPQISLYEISGPMFFGAASMLQDNIQHKKGEILILRLKHALVIDATGIHALELIIDKIHKNNGKIILSTIQPRVRKILEKHGLIKHIGGADYISKDTEEAINKAKKIIDSEKTK
ncbi:MAG: SulP family inorganic anion transporter [Candidatus Diapherotrites archaeon]|nr:SulP family inorganic anion transporter [Candidatus Diapherotrites archaeon]